MGFRFYLPFLSTCFIFRAMLGHEVERKRKEEENAGRRKIDFNSNELAFTSLSTASDGRFLSPE